MGAPQALRLSAATHTGVAAKFKRPVNNGGNDLSNSYWRRAHRPILRSHSTALRRLLARPAPEEPVKSKRDFIRRQLTWARSRGLVPDDRGYLKVVEQNLWRPLSASARAAFEKGSGSELRRSSDGRVKMCALHSSAALALNVFDHWAERDAAPMLKALGLDGSVKGSLRFEAQFPTGLRGTPPNLDIAFELESGLLVGIESKFTEWLTPKRKGSGPFKPKYFEDGATHWEAVGLSASQALAADLADGVTHFRFLDAPQLLKHALGLAQDRRTFSIRYVYFDSASDEGRMHRDEIADFAKRVGAELRFDATSYQSFYRALLSVDGVDHRYLEYLDGRYFGIEPGGSTRM